MTTPTPPTVLTTNPSRLAGAAMLLLAIAAMALVGAIVLAGLHDTIPDQLWTAFFAALTGGAGNALPTRSGP